MIKRNITSMLLMFRLLLMQVILHLDPLSIFVLGFRKRLSFLKLNDLRVINSHYPIILADLPVSSRVRRAMSGFKFTPFTHAAHLLYKC
jgi:hypothetical protein